MNIHQLLTKVIAGRRLKKAVFSKFTNGDIHRAEARLFRQNDNICVQVTFYRSDGKNLHRNYPETEAAGELAALMESCSQCNILTDGYGEAQIMVSKKGKVTVIDKLAAHETAADIPEHDRTKQGFLHNGTLYPFLFELGISDKEGRIIDRKAEKFRQINSFLHIVDTAVRGITSPAGERLRVIDLCCGKSYLTFAIWHYFTHIRRVPVEITGMDLKPDVISHCTETARKLGCEGINFLCGDINTCLPEHAPDIVISLHACDVATDIVLANAVRWGSRVILSAPCCQHELYGQIDRSAVPVIGEYPLLLARYAALVTDALRGRLLEAEGYAVDMVEFCDPDDTPKNLLIRAILKSAPVSAAKRDAFRRECAELCEKHQLSPSLMRLLKERQ